MGGKDIICKSLRQRTNEQLVESLESHSTQGNKMGNLVSSSKDRETYD